MYEPENILKLERYVNMKRGKNSKDARIDVLEELVDCKGELSIIRGMDSAYMLVLKMIDEGRTGDVLKHSIEYEMADSSRKKHLEDKEYLLEVFFGDEGKKLINKIRNRISSQKWCLDHPEETKQWKEGKIKLWNKTYENAMLKDITVV